MTKDKGQRTRPAAPADTPALVALAGRTGVFKPFELVALQEVLDDLHAANHAHGHRAAVAVGAGGAIAGFVYHAPAAMTDRSWEVWWIAVDPGCQSTGVGRLLLDLAESDIRAAAGRAVFIETSSTPAYHATRGFYLKCGYALAAEVADYYADGDGKVIYAKRLTAMVA